MHKSNPDSKPSPSCILLKWLLKDWDVDELSLKSNAIFSPRLCLMIGIGVICILSPYIFSFLFETNMIKPIVFIIIVLVVLTISFFIYVYIMKPYLKELRCFYKFQYVRSKNKKHITRLIKRTIKSIKIQKEELTVLGVGLSILTTLSDTTIQIIIDIINSNNLLSPSDKELLKGFTERDFLNTMKLSLYSLFFIEIYPIYKFYSILSNELEFILATNQHKRIHSKEHITDKVEESNTSIGTIRTHNIIIEGDVKKTINLSITPLQKRN